MIILTAILLLFLAIPLGLYLSVKARDELRDGRRWFVLLLILSIASGLGFGIAGEYEISFASSFIAITSFISYIKSFDRKRIKAK
jgi:hypothetical protein